METYSYNLDISTELEAIKSIVEMVNADIDINNIYSVLLIINKYF